jgi:hypothetical protein
MHTILRSVRRFADTHDNLPAFHASYLVLTFLAASLFTLGTFGLLIVGHMALDFVKYRDVHRYDLRSTVCGMLRESLIDITLFLLGLLFAVYLHHSLPIIASLSGIARAEITILRAFAVMTPKLKILYDGLQILSHLHHYLEFVHPRFNKGLSFLDSLCVISLCTSLVLLLLAPTLLMLDVSHLHSILAEQLIPGIL